MLGSAEGSSGLMAPELGPQASSLFRPGSDQTPTPRPELCKPTRERRALAFPAVGGPATPQQELRGLVANAPNAQPGRRACGRGDSANPRSRAEPDVERAQSRAFALRREVAV